MNTARSILHLDLDSFFVSVERLRNPQLQGKPLIIGGRSDRGVVASCSYETRQFGVHSAMPVRLARQLCPQAMIISGDMEAYSQYSKLVTEIIADKAPLFEKSSIDEFYIDASGMDRFFGCYQWGRELRQTIMKESGLPISLGLSVNKMVSKVATGVAKPNGEKEVPRGEEKDFLAPMAISKIPMAGKVTCQLLYSMGVSTVATLREIPVELMENLLGKNGLELWKKANAIDDTPVVPFSERKSISTENTFDKDTIDIKMLKSLLISMVEEIAFKLRSEQKLTACVAVKIRYSNFDTATRQVQIPYTSADHILIRHALELFDKLYDRRMLIRLIGVRFSHLVHGSYQIHLFDDTETYVNLYQAMDCIRFRHGADKIMRAVGIGTGKMKVEDTAASLTRLRYQKK
ncbi:DNA polymerase IV [soil metagenome]